ncbi:hypothetical protein CHLRE_16g672753v5 [Chlamydomonas reinhardtii]|uniref:MAT1 centre domain-containing protein n=1 Tax=Chlamydomonas reinhardtii TaxID=3055 RepID=A8JBD7_CHLRE|nr:uncharacterized protein CHLRE_16g672753v5 [Chlamydomonas reinhardtii]XP_042915729.1 uncharacterized protein CHLRE_16g672753v5 [Chlamydomonas reinhardtii]PNW71751.1 hypothetical protein CHLRE_16g672753v5 [Chlamydomonas reinhardtii]PNW71752.1 hypothetical protein CHLRE_16g672753v5 [Chlamydomonas reinhardtii]|eukprot:XP_001699216.1 predicted protein [Chlamydomonas reinhardtii]
MEIDLEKELKVRRRILAIYNKDRDDFDSKEKFDDYLEEVEDIIWRLSNNVDIERTEAQVRRYRSANQEQINSKSARQANMGADLHAAALDAIALAAVAAAKAAAPSMTGGLPMILPKLAQDYSALLEGGREVKYDSKVLAKSGSTAAAAGGWSASVWQSRLSKEAFSSLLWRYAELTPT